MLTEGNYSQVHHYAAEDNGMPYQRRVALDTLRTSIALGTPTDGRGYARDNVMGPALEEIEYALTASLRDYERDPYNFYNPGKPSGSDFADGSIRKAPPEWQDGYFDVLKDAVGKSREEYNNAYRKLLGDDLFENNGTFTIKGSSEADALRKFNQHADAHKYGDGLPLVPPTTERVDAMLAATTRDPDELLGKIFMRKGNASVRTVAVNAVMAGAKPEQFPVILAAMEAMCEDVENTNRMHHGLTSGASYSMLFFVGGPIVKDIGMETDGNFFGANNEVNNAIGRAIRLAILNTSHNWRPHIDTARSGRHNDLTFFIVAENEDALPAGWDPFPVDAGFPAGSSVVGVTSIGRYMDQLKNAGQTNENWTAAGLRQSLRAQSDASTHGVIILTPEQAKAMAASEEQGGLGLTKQTARDRSASALSTSVEKYVIVAGTDPGRAMLFGANTHGNANSLHLKLISTATKAEAGTAKDMTPPGIPQNFTVKPGEDPGTAVLSWDPPVRQGRGVTRYEVTAQERDYGIWLTVEGGADARSITLTNLDGATEYSFRLRAVYAGAWAYGTVRDPDMQGWGGARSHDNPGTNPIDTALRGAPSSTRALPAKGAPAIIQTSLKDIGGASVPSYVQGFYGKIADDTATLIWRAPIDNGGLDITSYEYRYRAGTSGDWGDWTAIADSPSALYNAAGNRYIYSVPRADIDVVSGNAQFQIRAVNDKGASSTWFTNPDAQNIVQLNIPVIPEPEPEPEPTPAPAIESALAAACECETCIDEGIDCEDCEDCTPGDPAPVKDEPGEPENP